MKEFSKSEIDYINFLTEHDNEWKYAMAREFLVFDLTLIKDEDK